MEDSTGTCICCHESTYQCSICHTFLCCHKFQEEHICNGSNRSRMPSNKISSLSAIGTYHHTVEDNLKRKKCREKAFSYYSFGVSQLAFKENVTLTNKGSLLFSHMHHEIRDWLTFRSGFSITKFDKYFWLIYNYKHKIACVVILKHI